MLRSKLLPAGCALALTLPACVETDSSLYVAGVLLGKTPECEYKADQGSPLLPSGVMDVGFITGYEAKLLVGLQLATRGDKTKLRAETMVFQVRGAEVRLTNSVGDLVDEFSVPSGGATFPVSANTPSFGVSEVILVPSSVGENLRSSLKFGERRTLVAEVRVFGDTLGGAELTSGSFSYVIEVCHGCLATWVEDGLTYDATRGRMICDDRVTEPYISQGCNPAQEGRVDCRLCQTDRCFFLGDD